MYNGLTTADKGALLDAKARGAEWVAKQWGGTACGFQHEPVKEPFPDDAEFGWVAGWVHECGETPINLGTGKFDYIRPDDAEHVNIDIALAQIAEMEKNQVLSEIIDSIENPKPQPWKGEAT